MDARGPFASASRSVRLAAVLAMTMALGTPGPGHTQIVRDGTVGPAGPLTGPNYTIPHTDGTRAGPNLFHSFSRFNLHTDESATFTGPSEIANVISRVTGGERSAIDGLLRSHVGQANVWFLNPAGVLFGPQARLDVPAAFHVSTADEVRFADGARFSASQPAASRLTTAPPEAFGFLRPTPAGIAVHGSTLQTQAGQTLSVVGGDLQVTGGQIGSAGGQVNLVAMAGPGTVQAATGASTAPARGAIRVAQKAQVDTSGNGDGQITIRGGQIEVTGSNVTTDNTSAQEARRGITVAGDTVRVMDNSRIASSTRGRGKAGHVAVTAQAVELYNGAQIGSFTEAQGKAGSVSVRAGNIELQDRGKITSETSGPGQAGDVVVRASGSLTVASNTRPAGDVDTSTASDTYIGSDTYGPGAGHAGSVIVEAGQLRVVGNGGLSYTGIFSGAYENRFGRPIGRPTGNAGHVTVNAGRIELHNDGQISTNTQGTGNAGEVDVKADQLQVVGDGSSSFRGRRYTGIASLAELGSTGNAGHVTVSAGDLELHYSGLIGSDTYGPGQAGPVAVTGNRLLISGDGSSGYTGISSDAGGSGVAGSVSVTAHDSLVLRDGGQISSDTYSEGQAGNVTVTGRTIELRNSGQISSKTSSDSTGAGGAVEIAAGALLLAEGATITTESASLQNAGAIAIAAQNLTLTGGASIASSATQADAGRITITTPGTLWLTESSITTDATQGEGGQINLRVGHLIGLFSGSQVTTSATGGGSTGNAGNITIDPQLLVLDRNSLIKANARGGNGGRIDITADTILLWPPLEERIQAHSERGINGRIEINSPNTDVGGTLRALPTTFFDATRLFPIPCAARVFGGTRSSLAEGGPSGLPTDPSRLLAAPYLGTRTPERAGASAATVAAGSLTPVALQPTGTARLSFACGS